MWSECCATPCTALAGRSRKRLTPPCGSALSERRVKRGRYRLSLKHAPWVSEPELTPPAYTNPPTTSRWTPSWRRPDAGKRLDRLRRQPVALRLRFRFAVPWQGCRMVAEVFVGTRTDRLARTGQWKDVCRQRSGVKELRPGVR